MKISVALCTYNGETFLAEQLDSILLQTASVDEIVVCDDASDDDTRKILKEYGRKHPALFRLFFNDKNIGYVKNFEKALSLCTGNLIFLCDQDDVWKRNKVEILTAAARQNPEKNVFAHKIQTLESSGEKVDCSFWDQTSLNTKADNASILENLLFDRNVFPGMSLMITADAKQKYLPLQSTDGKIIHDYEILIKSCRDNSFHIVDQPLALYRVHEKQSIGFTKNFEKDEKDDQRSIYYKIKRISRLRTWTETYGLDKTYLKDYKVRCTAEYKKFLLTLPFPQNWIMHWKMKYYYKVLDEIS